MKTTYSFLKRTCLFLALFCWLVPTNLMAQIAIGTGTVTLDYTNTSNPAAPVSNTYINSALDNEVCITLGQYNSSTLAYTGSFVYNSGDIQWSVTITPGIYDINVTYGTGAWGTRPYFELYDGAAKVADIFQAPADQTSGANPGVLGLSGTNTIDLSGLTDAKVYILKVIDGWGGAYGTCIGHISFTRLVGMESMVTADYLQAVASGETTLPSINSTNNTTNANISVVNQNVIVEEWSGTKYMIFDADDDYLDINLASDYRICGIATATYYDGSGEGQLNIKYSLSSTYDDSKQTGSVVRISGGGGDNCTFGAAPGTISMNSNDIPDHAKSARIYKTGTREWGIKLLRLKVSIIEDVCVKNTVSFVKAGSETGSAPSDMEVCSDGSFIFPDKKTLAYTGYKFEGWSADGGTTTYAPGETYDMEGVDVEFTAQWSPMVLPTITNLTLDGAEKTVTLSWGIPGICDLSNPVAATKSANPADMASASYDAEGDFVTVSGTSPIWEQFGVAFAIPATTNLEWISFEYKGYHDDISMWGGMCDNSYAYWSGNAPSLNDAANWQSSGQQVPVYSYWHDGMGGAITSKTISQIAVYANAGNGTYNDVTFSVRNVRYHVSGQEDIDHIVVVRKDGSAPANPTDGDQIYNGTKYSFVDADASKVDGHTYYYRVFSVHADGSYSAPAAVSYTLPGAAALEVHTRNLPVGEYGTICLPYEVEAANIVGADVFELAGWPADANAVTLNQIAGNMEAGHPYIFQATAATSTFSYAESGYQDAQSINGLIGSYTQEIIEANANNYIIYDNKLYLVDVEAYVGAYRAYINRTAAQGAVAAPAPGKRQIVLYVNGTQTTTGIDQLSSTPANGKFIKDGQLFILRDGKTYNAQGIEIK